VTLRVLTWNLMHGRSIAPARRDLFADFAAALERWQWDVALLQEVPPWWPAALAQRLGSAAAMVLTSRNFGLPVRRAVAVRWPDLIKSNGGGCNAVLANGFAIAERRALRLSVTPERRWLLGVRLTGPGELWVGNLHANGRPPGAAADETRRAGAAMLGWAAAAMPVVLGGDFNLRSPAVDGYTAAGGYRVDHVFVRGLQVTGGPLILERGSLSDHAPVLVAVTRPEGHQSTTSW
jgi:endonuclease/exonuclease/phosphatase family metal-dependent hydrolase